MSNQDTQTPSTQSLIISSLCAVVLATVVLFLFILPAEYGIDPSGLGKKIGLTALAEASSNANAKPTIMSCNQRLDNWQDAISIEIPANQGVEYKFLLDKGAKIEFAWHTQGGELYFDFHGEPKGDTSGYFQSFKEATDLKNSGELTAPFSGSHGWYWENRQNRPITVQLSTRGEYQILGIM